MAQNQNPNNISPEEAGRILAYLDNLDARDKAVYSDLEAAIKKIIEKHFPDIFELEAEGYHKLDDRISRHICNLRLDICNIIYRNKSK